MKKVFPAAFSDLMRQYRDTSAGLGHDHPISRRLWLLVEHTAPEWFRAEMHSMAEQMNLIPTPKHCDVNGQPVFTADDLAGHMGMSREETEAAVEQFIEDRKAVGLPVDGIKRGSDSDLNPLH